MRWRVSHHFDPPAVALADRHYSRVRPGTPQFMPSGRKFVLVTPEGDAVWGSSYQVSYDGIHYAWYSGVRDAWVCTIFRNESPHLSSELVREAIAATMFAWGEPPPDGFMTFVDAERVRRKRDPGRCFIRAGFRREGETKGGLVILRLALEDFPAADPALGAHAAFVVPPVRTPVVARRTRIGGAVERLPAPD
jgi:hypothetical protein